MSAPTTSPSPGEVLLYVIGAGAFIFFVIKGMIIGFYPDEAAGVFVAAGVAAVSVLIAQRLTGNRKRAVQSARDRANGVQ